MSELPLVLPLPAAHTASPTSSATRSGGMMLGLGPSKGKDIIEQTTRVEVKPAHVWRTSASVDSGELHNHFAYTFKDV